MSKETYKKENLDSDSFQSANLLWTLTWILNSKLKGSLAIEQDSMTLS